MNIPKWPSKPFHVSTYKVRVYWGRMLFALGLSLGLSVGLVAGLQLEPRDPLECQIPLRVEPQETPVERAPVVLSGFQTVAIETVTRKDGLKKPPKGSRALIKEGFPLREQTRVVVEIDGLWYETVVHKALGQQRYSVYHPLHWGLLEREASQLRISANENSFPYGC